MIQFRPFKIAWQVGTSSMQTYKRLKSTNSQSEILVLQKFSVLQYSFQPGIG